MELLTRLLILFLYLLVFLGSALGEEESPNAVNSKMPNVSSISEAFKSKQSGPRDREAQVLFGLIKPGMSRQSVRDLLGQPESKSTDEEWFYTTFYSKFIGIRFENDTVIEKFGTYK